MVFLNSLPVVKMAPVQESAGSRSSRRDPDTDAARPEESGVLSFSGILDQRQKSQDLPRENGRNDGAGEKTDQAGSHNNTPADEAQLTRPESSRDSLAGKGAVSGTPGEILRPGGHGASLTGSGLANLAGAEQVKAAAQLAGSPLAETLTASARNSAQVGPAGDQVAGQGAVKLTVMADIEPTRQTQNGDARLSQALQKINEQMVNDPAGSAKQVDAKGAPAAGLQTPQHTAGSIPGSANAEGGTASGQANGAASAPQESLAAAQTTVKDAATSQGKFYLPADMKVEGQNQEAAEQPKPVQEQAPSAAEISPESDLSASDAESEEKVGPNSRSTSEQASPAIATEAANASQNHDKGQDAGDAQKQAANPALGVSTANQTASRPVVNTQFAQGATSSEMQAQVRGQVLDHLTQHLDGSRQLEKLTIHLNPEKLGKVELQFQARGNHLEVIVTAGGREAEQALREGSRELSEAIADKSARFQQVDIRVESRGQESEKNDSRQDPKRDQSRREDDQQQNQRQQQEGRNRRGTGPDWAALRQEG